MNERRQEKNLRDCSELLKQALVSADEAIANLERTLQELRSNEGEAAIKDHQR